MVGTQTGATSALSIGDGRWALHPNAAVRRRGRQDDLQRRYTRMSIWPACIETVLVAAICRPGWQRIVDGRQAPPAATGSGRRLRPAGRPAGQAGAARRVDGDLGDALGWSGTLSHGAGQGACASDCNDRLRARAQPHLTSRMSARQWSRPSSAGHLPPCR